MGKSQYKKKTRRHNPIRVPDAHLGSGVAAAAKVAKEEDVLPVLKKLSSADASDRSWALSAITNLTSSNPALRRLFLSHALISLLIDRLTDSAENVIVEATGCLRNLMIDGGGDVGGEFVNKGGLVALASMVPRVSGTIERVLAKQRPEGEVEAASYRLVFPLAENIMSIFWSLSETSNKTLQALNNLNLTPFLMAFIERREELPRGVAVAAAQCLYALSSDNPPVQKALATSGSDVPTLLSVLSAPYSTTSDKGKAPAGPTAMDEDAPSEKAQRQALRAEADSERASLLQVLVAGVLKNLQVGDGRRKFKALQTELEGLDEQAEQVLTQVLDADLSAAVQEVQENVAASAAAPTPTDALKTDHKSIPEIRLESVERSLSSVMVALEVMTSICASATFADEDEPADEDMVDDADADEMDDDIDVDADGDDEALISHGRNPEDMDAVLAANEEARLANGSVLASTAGPSAVNRHSRIARLARPTPLSFPPGPDARGFIAPSLYPPATSLLSAIHLRSLEALNNLLLTTALLAPSPTPPLAGEARVAPPEVQEWNASIVKRYPGLQNLWNETFEWAKAFAPDPAVLLAAGQEVRAECLEALCGVWWGLAKIGALGALSVSGDQLQILADVYGVVGSAEAKVRLVGAMSALALRPQVTVPENQAIGAFLIGLVQALSAGAPISSEVVVAALNGIFDVYADERAIFDRDVFVGGGFLQVLAGSVSKVKSMAKGIDKRKEPELRGQAEEAYENLLAFIKYRRSVR